MLQIQKEDVKESRENLAIARVREKMGKCGKEEEKDKRGSSEPQQAQEGVNGRLCRWEADDESGNERDWADSKCCFTIRAFTIRGESLREICRRPETYTQAQKYCWEEYRLTAWGGETDWGESRLRSGELRIRRWWVVKCHTTMREKVLLA